MLSNPSPRRSYALLPAPTQHRAQCHHWCFLNCSVNDFYTTPAGLGANHLRQGSRAGLLQLCPTFFPPSQSTGVPTQGHHLPQGRAAPGPCWSFSQDTVTFSQHWFLGCSQCQSPDERSPTVKHLLTWKAASKRTTWGLLQAGALLAGEEMSKHAGEGEAVLDRGLDEAGQATDGAGTCKRLCFHCCCCSSEWLQ